MKSKIDQNEVFYITYADGIYEKNEKPLKTLNKIAKKYLKEFSTIHILPFYPSTSDKGFSVSDYFSVDESYGAWRDILNLKKSHKLMFDLVINHTSKSHEWFKKCLKNDGKYSSYYISFNKKPLAKNVFRPRKKPLFTKIENKFYWTTFSSDQIDLNFKNPELQKEVFSLTKYYVEKGSDYLRLDAIAYIFKNLKTTCVNLPEVHQFIKKIKNKKVKLISEVNLSNKIIDSYRDNSLVYDFSIPVLVYYSLHTGDGSNLSKYLNENKKNSFNFLASHDGIGLTAGRELLGKKINYLIKDVEKKNFHISYGKKVPYELNINYFDALDRNVDKFLCAHSILLCMKGIPGIYYHSLFGSYGNKKYVEPREVNRKKINLEILQKKLISKSVNQKIFLKINELIKIRKKFHEFSSEVKQKSYFKNNILIIKRITKSSEMVCMFNLSKNKQKIPLCFDEITHTQKNVLKPFEYVWVKS